MSSLTEEQRKRMEENRRKALEKRAALSLNRNKMSSSLTNVKDSSSHNSFQNNSIKDTFLSSNQSRMMSMSTIVKDVNPCQSFQKISNSSSIAQSFYSSKPITSNNGTCQNFLKNNSVSENNKINNKVLQNYQVLKGACVLQSRIRFYVDVGYNKELIDIFKSIPNKLYDVQRKKWNFPISDHEKLMSLVKSLQPQVLIIPLHPYIIKTFAKVSPDRTIIDHDLSCLDPCLHNALLPFQREGVNFGIQLNGRVLIADDMGLGKTIQAIAIANYYIKDWPLLVITPSSVRYTWEEAFHTWMPSLDPVEITVINSGKDYIPDSKVVLMSYEMLKKFVANIKKLKFKSIILDESHFLKNHKSARTKAFQEVVKGMNRVIMLTGTPALSRPIELYTQISGLCSKKFLSFSEYGMRYCDGKMTNWGMNYSGSSNMEELRLLLEEIVMIRRLKSEVITQLPPKFRQMIVLDPSRVHSQNSVLRAMSRKMKDITLNTGERRGVLMEYFHQTGEAKLAAVCEYIVDLLEADKKFICFGHHQVVLNGISKAIESQKIDYIRIDGSVSSEQRKKLCDKFQFQDQCKVAVLSITSANCGITLTAASLVVFAELFWNPGILTQAEDRAHRIGQQDSVVVQYLVAKSTADDEIWPLVQRKLDILNKAGLSKDNFKSADTIVKEDTSQSRLDDFWNLLDESLNTCDTENDFDVPIKKLKMYI